MDYNWKQSEQLALIQNEQFVYQNYYTLYKFRSSSWKKNYTFVVCDVLLDIICLQSL
jgi:hypothetical protein